MINTFASLTITLFMPVPCLRCVHYCFASNISSCFHYRCYQLNVSTTMSTCSASYYSHTFAMFSVILMLRTYAFSGRKRWILAILSITLFGLVGVNIWVMSRELSCLSRGPCLSRCHPDVQWNCSAPLVRYSQPHQLFRHFRPTNYQHRRGQWSRDTLDLSLGSASRIRHADLTILT